jgi:hypothetical protein
MEQATVVHQGVRSFAHTTLSRQLFRQSLGAYLREDREQADALLSQARTAIESGPRPPRGYRVPVGLQQERIDDIERFEGRVPPEYIKEKYIDELSHRDVVWNALCRLLDRVTGMAADYGREFDEFRAFKWANSMVDELSKMLPVAGHELDRQDVRPDNWRTNGVRDQIASFWLERANIAPESDVEGAQRKRGQKFDPQRITIAAVAGACFGFERRRQGTRKELAELMDRYLELRSHNDRL